MMQCTIPSSISSQTFAQAPIGICYADRSGQLFDANLALCKFLGFEQQTLQKMFIAQITHPDDLTHTQVEYERLWCGEINVLDVEKRYLHSDGRAVWVRATTALVRNERGVAACTVEFLRDISARKDLAAALLENQRLLQAVITDLPISIRACDVDGRIFLYNDAAARLYAIRAPCDAASTAPHISHADVFLPDGQTPVPSEERLLPRALRGEDLTNIEFLIRQPEGSARSAVGSARRLLGPNGECLGAVAITQDVTEKKLLERELASAQKLESIGQLAAGIAHEINTPTQFIGDNIRFLHESVGEILRVVQRLLSGDDIAHYTPASREAISEIFEAIDFRYLLDEVPKAFAQSLDGIARISNIVGAMKEFSHPATDKAPHDLNRAILSTIVVATNEWKYVADVKTDLSDDLPFTPVMPGAFNQVILNMLVNAAHAIGAVSAEAGREKGLITIATRRVGDWAEVRIQDTGCGMPEDIRHRIFDPFFTTKPVGKGTGQGLAIAHDVIVNKHQGAIAVESAPGVGTTFVLRLPLNVLSTGDAITAAA